MDPREPHLKMPSEWTEADDVQQIERCAECKDDALPCFACAEKARELEKEGKIILLEDGYCIPLPEGPDDGDGEDD